MARQRRESPRFRGRIEPLEDRRVMSTAPWDAAPLLEHHDLAGQDPPVEHHAEQHVLGEPDFWIDPSDQTDLDAYFEGVSQMLVQAHNLTGWFNVRNNYGFTGLGQTVAVIDSGIAWDHFALGGGLGANYRVVGGWDFTEENDANPYDDGPSGSHGTHVAGIVGGNHATHTGVAPGVDLVALRVFNDAGQGFFSWIENALRWIYNNRNSFANPITAVNLSLGVSSWNAATVPSWANLEDEFAQLKSAGIFIAVSAGNSYSSYNAPGLSYPAASSYVVPVMSTDDAGQMSPFSQRLDRAIAAPGQNIISTVPDYNGNNNGAADDFGAKSGTSMAAPYVAGASVLIRQAMQFVGMANITQDTIYNHMVATADVFFDAATGQSYKRLNLARAIDALMPADDYGSTTATAFDLGTISGGTTTTGVISKLTDVDCFRFTAGATGKVTFAATGAAGMTPAWQVWGATPLTAQALGAVSFNVVAGQTYTVGLSASGLGAYSIASTLESSLTFTDWGSVAFTQVDDVGVQGETWYRIQASRTGILTAQAAFNAAAGGVQLALFNASLQSIANGIATGSGARVDFAGAVSGGVYYLRVTGANNDVDFKLLNLFTQTGSTVSVGGTAAAENYVFSVGAFHVLTVNGVGYGWTPGSVTQFTIQAGGGTDSITLNGGAGAETVWLEATKATMAGTNFLLAAHDVETKTANSGGGADFAYLFDSAGNDAVSSAPQQVTMTLASGHVLQAKGFARTKAWAMFGGVDAASLYDSAGNDAYFGGAYRGAFIGGGFNNEVQGFKSIVAYSTTGGVDQATLYDSWGDDTLAAHPQVVSLAGPGYAHETRNFEKVKAWAVNGGFDVATLYDSPGNDHYFGSALRGVMMGAGFNNDVEGFQSIVARANAGGSDQATLYDTAGNDTFSAWADRASLTGQGFANEVRGFAKAAAKAVSGGVDRVRYYGSSQPDALTGAGHRATFSGVGFLYEAEGFDEVTAHGLQADDAVTLGATDYVFSQVGA